MGRNRSCASPPVPPCRPKCFPSPKKTSSDDTPDGSVMYPPSVDYFLQRVRDGVLYQTPEAEFRRKRIWLLHGQLGRGGAERWTLDTADALSRCDHAVTVFSSRAIDRRHCFTDLLRPQLYECHSAPNVLPLSFFGRFVHLFSVIDMILLMIYLAGCVIIKLFYPPDVIIIDHVPYTVSVLKFLFPDASIIFYCHFPDTLLNRSYQDIHAEDERGDSTLIQGCDFVDRKTVFRRAYKSLMYAWEAQGLEDPRIRIITNSEFTRTVLKRHFDIKKRIDVLYPTWRTKHVIHRCRALQQKDPMTPEWSNILDDNYMIILSFNRLHPNKRHEMAIRAFSDLHNFMQYGAEKLRLVIAGVAQDSSYISRLELMIPDHVKHQVFIVGNVSDYRKNELFSKCMAVIYTPVFEHFGIGVCEALAYGKPVVVSAFGGPSEILQTPSILSRLLVDDPYSHDEYAKGLAYALNHCQNEEFTKAAYERARTFSFITYLSQVSYAMLGQFPPPKVYKDCPKGLVLGVDDLKPSL